MTTEQRPRIDPSQPHAYTQSPSYTYTAEQRTWLCQHCGLPAGADVHRVKEKV